MGARRPLLLLLAAVSLTAFALQQPARPDAYLSAARPVTDSTRPIRSTMEAAPSAGAAVLVSIAGLPPVAGTLAQSGGSVVFRPHGGGDIIAFPLFQEPGRPEEPRRPAVRLLEVAAGDPDPLFLFHLGGAVVETSAPGILGTIAAEPGRVAELGTPWSTGVLTLVPAHDQPAALGIVQALVRTPYADSLFSLFGNPPRPLGLVGSRGRKAGRLGEFLASRDSIALSPDQMTSVAQLRHAFAHELAHHWLRTHPQSGKALTAVMRPIRDSLRYGFRDADEQLAETLAFAVHFLQASSGLPAFSAAPLLHSYERLVPGTRNAALLLLGFPAYERHPLAGRAGTLRGPD